MINIEELAVSANMVINGYAYTKEDKLIKVLNLRNTEKAVVLDVEGNVIETNTDDIETGIARDYYLNNMEFMEV